MLKVLAAFINCMILNARGLKYYQESKCLVLEVNSILVVSFDRSGALCEHIRTYKAYAMERLGSVTSNDAVYPIYYVEKVF